MIESNLNDLMSTIINNWYNYVVDYNIIDIYNIKDWETFYTYFTLTKKRWKKVRVIYLKCIVNISIRTSIIKWLKFNNNIRKLTYEFITEEEYNNNK